MTLLRPVTVVAFMVGTCFGLDSVSLNKYEAGRAKYRELELYSTNENYGKCWINAVEVIKVGCHEFTEETHAKMALAYLNCFLEMQGRHGYVCSASDPVHHCTEQLSDTDRANYATFFTHTHSICYFLQSQVWHEKTQSTIRRLSTSSEQVADQLEESSRLQLQVIQRQNQSLKNQENILDKANNLSKIINSSSENIHDMLSDFQKTSVEQRLLINNLFDRVAQVQTLVTGEMSTVYSLVYYISAIFIAYFLTSSARTSSARLWIFTVLMVSMVTEWVLVFYVFKAKDKAQSFQEQADSEVWQWILKLHNVFTLTVVPDKKGYAIWCLDDQL